MIGEALQHESYHGSPTLNGVYSCRGFDNSTANSLVYLVVILIVWDSYKNYWFSKSMTWLM